MRTATEEQGPEKSSAFGVSADDMTSVPVIVRVSVGNERPQNWRDWHPLHWLRVEAGWTIRDLADRSGLAPFQIQAYECGSTMPRIDSAFKLARALGVTVDKLFGIPYKRQARTDGDR